MEDDLTLAIQSAIRQSGLPQLVIARQAGITAGQLSRFMRSERTLTLPASSKVCRILGLKLVPATKTKRKGT
jgi:DNA-binding phage protein